VTRSEMECMRQYLAQQSSSLLTSFFSCFLQVMCRLSLEVGNFVLESLHAKVGVTGAAGWSVCPYIKQNCQPSNSSFASTQMVTTSFEIPTSMSGAALVRLARVEARSQHFEMTHPPATPIFRMHEKRGQNSGKGCPPQRIVSE